MASIMQSPDAFVIHIHLHFYSSLSANTASYVSDVRKLLCVVCSPRQFASYCLQALTITTQREWERERTGPRVGLPLMPNTLTQVQLSSRVMLTDVSRLQMVILSTRHFKMDESM